MKSDTVVVFRSQLGWIGVIASGIVVKQLTFGHSTASAARLALDPELLKNAKQPKGTFPLAERLRAYASGIPDEFRDVQLDPGPLSEFRRRVLERCRRIRYGDTVSYAELASQSGYAGAARAVGNCMAGNRIPLLIPCHRVVCSDGKLGAYSAAGGIRTKRRLLILESHHPSHKLVRN